MTAPPLSQRAVKAVTAIARKIVVLFYNALRHGMDYADPGASYYADRYLRRVLGKLRRAVRSRGHFPTDEAALKLLFLVLNLAAKEWKMPPREWAMARAQLAILFGDRFNLA